MSHGRPRFLRYVRRAGMLLLGTVGVGYLLDHRHSLFAAMRIAYGAPPRDWVLGLVASAMLALSTGGVYRECLRTAGVDVPLTRATRLALASHFFNCAVPGGKLSSIVLFTAEADRRTDAPGRGAAGFFTASVVGRVGLTVVALATLPFTTRVGMAPLVVVLLFALYAAITVVRVGAFAFLHRRHDRLQRWESRARTRMRRSTKMVRDDDAAMWTACVADQWAHRSHFVPAVAWSLAGKLAGAALVTIGVHAAGGSIPIGTALSLYAVATIAGSLALVPVGLGVVELTMMHSLTVSGLTIAQAAAALIIYRLFQLWLPMLVGLVGLIGLRRVVPSDDVPLVVIAVEPAVVAATTIATVGV